ncbi:MAG TPA: RHS repeat-associated core domain-containing protein [Verrucomicrobiae bacterium]
MKSINLLIATGLGLSISLSTALSGYGFFHPGAHGPTATSGTLSGSAIHPASDYRLFGEVIRATGPMAKSNPCRFSTKHQDEEPDLLYYGFRYYNASTGRWLSRDPIGEAGSENVFAHVRNNAINLLDSLGLEPESSINHNHYSTTFAQYFDYTEQWDASLGENVTTRKKWEVKGWSIPPATIRHGPESCCWMLGVHGRAEIRWDSTDYPNGSHTQHEYRHLDITKDVYRSMADFIFDYAFRCVSKKQLDCLLSNLSRVVFAYDKKRWIENVRYHVTGGYPEGSPAWEHEKGVLDANDSMVAAVLADATIGFSLCLKK